MIAEIGFALHIGGPWLYSMRVTLFLDYFDDLTKAGKRQSEIVKKLRDKQPQHPSRGKRGRRRR